MARPLSAVCACQSTSTYAALAADRSSCMAAQQAAAAAFCTPLSTRCKHNPLVLPCATAAWLLLTHADCAAPALGQCCVPSHVVHKRTLAAAAGCSEGDRGCAAGHRTVTALNRVGSIGWMHAVKDSSGHVGRAVVAGSNIFSTSSSSRGPSAVSRERVLKECAGAAIVWALSETAREGCPGTELVWTALWSGRVAVCCVSSLLGAAWAQAAALVLQGGLCFFCMGKQQLLLQHTAWVQQQAGTFFCCSRHHVVCCGMLGFLGFVQPDK